MFVRTKLSYATVSICICLTLIDFYENSVCFCRSSTCNQDSSAQFCGVLYRSNIVAPKQKTHPMSMSFFVKFLPIKKVIKKVHKYNIIHLNGVTFKSNPHPLSQNCSQCKRMFFLFSKHYFYN